MQSGERFNRLVAVKQVGKNKFNHPIWLFKCDCGETKEIIVYSVSSGHTQSCGCLNREIICNQKANLRHGYCGTRLYRTWKGIRQRCNANENDKNFKWYSSKGIKVCNEWNDFETFKNWAFENGYNDSLTIDRIDVNGDYEPSNCRWATYKEQANNKSNNVFYSAYGETHNIEDWCKITGLARCTIYVRLRKFHGDFEKAISTKPRKKV